jgi:hypothetical protein
VLRKVVLAAAAGAVLVVISGVGAAAASDPFTKGTAGYDYSYPQCGSAAPSAAFGIAGVDAGYPFNHFNTCLGAEYAAAARTGNAGVYVNTGYDPSYTDTAHTTSDCATKSASVSGDAAHQAAWAVGCSEAEKDVAQFNAATNLPAGAPTAWWLDVETANSWSTTDLTLNQYTLGGLVATLRAVAATAVGVYSTPAEWTAITGSAYHAAVDGEWDATGQRSLKRAKAYCGKASFSGAPIWIVQYVTTIDIDYAC